MDPQLLAFAELVKASPHNLVSRGDRELLLERHIPECVAVANRLPSAGRLIDVGSGGGFPGLVIAIVRPDLEVHLVESVGKKARFLTEAAEELALAVVVHHARSEDLARGELGGSFPLATARAVARLELLVPMVMPLLLPGGEFWAIKGERWREELREARGVIRKHRAEIIETPDDRAGVTEETEPRVLRLIAD